MKESRQPTVQQTIDQSASPAHYSIAQKLDHALPTSLLPACLIWFLLVSYHLISKLNLLYQLQLRKHLIEYDIPKLHNLVKDCIVQPKLAEAKYFSGTTDLW